MRLFNIIRPIGDPYRVTKKSIKWAVTPPKRKKRKKK